MVPLKFDAIAQRREWRKLWGMKKSKERRLIPTKFVRGVPAAGRCSVCHRPFEVQVPSDSLESLGNSRHWLLVDFGSHTCDDAFSQTALHIVRKSTPED